MTKYTSALKARNIQDEIAAHGFERGVVKCLEMLAEYQGVIRESQFEIAQRLDQMSTIIGQFVTVAERMKTTIETLQAKDREVGDDTHH